MDDLGVPLLLETAICSKQPQKNWEQLAIGGTSAEFFLKQQPCVPDNCNGLGDMRREQLGEEKGVPYAFRLVAMRNGPLFVHRK